MPGRGDDKLVRHGFHDLADRFDSSHFAGQPFHEAATFERASFSDMSKRRRV
ncbi:MAG: hypothetical protein M3410_06780 [Acidobacteriota bacterium]|nr:hypothetical protein [Acidobacteriota bacterium]